MSVADCCYIIARADNRKSYVGWTNQPATRIRQHCGVLAGGAKATRGSQWHYVALLQGLADARNAQQCEWKIKRMSRGKRPAGRVAVLVQMLQDLDKWTRNSTVLNKDMPLRLLVRASHACTTTDPRVQIVNSIVV